MDHNPIAPLDPDPGRTPGSRIDKDHYRTLFEHNLDAVLLTMADGRILAANPAACALFGGTEEEICRGGREALLDPTDPRMPALLEERRRTGRVRGELAWRRIDGSRFPGEFSSVILNAEGRAFEIVRDLSELAIACREAQRAREEAERKAGELDAAMEAIADGVILCGPDGTIRRMNAMAESILGYSAEERRRPHAERMALREMAWPDGRPLPSGESPTGRAFRGEVVKSFPMILRRKADGETVWISVSAAPIRNAEGRIVGAISSFSDVSQQIQAERELRELTVTLEHQVAERTRVAEKRARLLQALAVQLTEAEERERRRLAGLLHDDLQQILASARLQLQSLRQGGLPAEETLQNVNGLLEEAIRKSRRLSHELSPAILHHSGLADSLEWLAGQMKEQHGLEVGLETEGWTEREAEPLKVFLFRCAQELLFNVAKHAGVSRAEVRLTESADRLILEVSDRGKGFDPKTLEPAAGKAGGFGLFSLHERTQAMGGRLTVQSEPGQGSRFTLTVPRGRAAGGPSRGAQAARPEKPRAAARRSEGHGKTCRVLFADDHKVIRQGLISLLSGQPDIEVVGEAANGREAVELARELEPDLVVMDVSMPEMDGIEATRRIKAEQPGLHVIGLSMYEEESVATAMRQAGAEAFVSKAASAGSLLQAIYEVTGQR